MSRTLKEFTEEYSRRAIEVLEVIADELERRGYKVYGPSKVGHGLWGMAVHGIGMSPPDPLGIRREGGTVFFETPPAGERFPDASYAQITMAGPDLWPHKMGLLLDPLERDDDRRWNNLFRWVLVPEHIEEFVDAFDRKIGAKFKKSPKMWRPKR